MEYEALINELCIAIKLGATRLYIHGDSELVIGQVMESSCKSPLMAAYCQEVCKLKDKFKGIELHHIPKRTTMPPIFSLNWLPGGFHLQMGSSSTTLTSRPPAS